MGTRFKTQRCPRQPNLDPPATLGRPKFGEPETSLRGKSVCVTGEIFLFQGIPEIVLHDPAQLEER
jgi:hypothetical protein